MALELLSSFVVESIKGLFVPLKRQISYLRNYDKNIVNLMKEANRLSRMGTDVQNSVVEARGRLEEINEAVAKWLEEVDATGVKMTSLEERVSENKRCFKGLCSDWRSRCQISKQAVQMLLLVNELQAKGTFSTVSHVPPPSSVEPVWTDCVVGLRSRDLVLNRVMDALHDEHIRTIGLYGMGGIGKTTLVNELNNKPEVSQLFKKVIMVVVSNSPDFPKIQFQIGERLGLKLESDGAPQVRANKLLKRLQDEDSVLIIFDDVWTAFEVAAVIGIPTGDEHLGCKIIITTRIHDVCRGMGIQSAIKMEPLSEDESQVLFKAKAGDVVIRTTLAPLAEKIVRKCQGAPLAIVTLGSTLRDVEEEFEWKNALRALENPDPIELEGIIPEVISSLRYSYDHLKGPEIKLCFLFFCLFPEDYVFPLSDPDIRDYGIGEGFLNVDGSLEEASNKLYTYVSRLKACGLLTDFRLGCPYFVQMHDVVRDVAISIASDEDNGFWAKAGVRLRKWPETEILNRYKRISFMRSEGIELPSPLECPQLRTLLLNKNENLEINQDNFFERVKALTVLDLSRTSLNSIPKSLGYLTNLRTLYLRNLKNDLINISVLGGLKNLEILRMSGSCIKILPEEIGNLTNLRCLDLSETIWLSRVTPNVLSRLTKLEELCMYGSFKKWDVEEECSSSSGGQKNASFAEVASLANLVKLQIEVTIEGIASAEISCSWENLNSYHVIVGPKYQSSHSVSKMGERVLKIYKGNPMMSQWLRVLFERATHLFLLDSCYGVNSFTDLDAVRGGSSHLKYLLIDNGDEIDYLIRVDEEIPQDSFICLNELIITKMGNMKKIVHGLSSPKTFGNLEVLKIRGCNKLKSLFSFRLARNLQQLNHLAVEFCKDLVEIITIEDDEEEEAVDHQEGLLPQLKYVRLSGLNRLTSICRGSFLQHCPVKHFKVFGCPNLKRPVFRSELKVSSNNSTSFIADWEDGED